MGRSTNLWYSDTTKPAKCNPFTAVAQRRKSGFQISYVTIIYRSVFPGILLVSVPVALSRAFLAVNESVQHGHSVEVRCRTEPGARVMVNGEGAPKPDGSFSHFT